MQFQRRVSIGLVPQTNSLTGQVILRSSETEETCNLFLFSASITVKCGSKMFQKVDNSDLFHTGDVTDLWLGVDGGSGDTTPSAWDLRVVLRRGRHTVHLLVPHTQLQPPVTLSWGEVLKDIQYYFNCITGEALVLSLRTETFITTFANFYDFYCLTTKVFMISLKKAINSKGRSRFLA